MRGRPLTMCPPEALHVFFWHALSRYPSTRPALAELRDDVLPRVQAGEAQASEEWLVRWRLNTPWARESVLRTLGAWAVLNPPHDVFPMVPGLIPPWALPPTIPLGELVTRPTMRPGESWTELERRVVAEVRTRLRSMRPALPRGRRPGVPIGAPDWAARHHVGGESFRAIAATADKNGGWASATTIRRTAVRVLIDLKLV